MIVVLIVLFVVVVGVVVAAAVGKFGSAQAADASMDLPGSTDPFELPKGRIGSQGAGLIRLDQSLRGYNMAQVDAVIDKLLAELGELEQENTSLRGDDESVTRVPTSSHPLSGHASSPEYDELHNRLSQRFGTFGETPH